MAMGFQKYLDEAFSKINIADFEESEPEEPPLGIFTGDSRTHCMRAQKTGYLSGRIG